MLPLDQTSNGKAYEYACLQSLGSAAGKTRTVVIMENSSLNVARNAWSTLSQETRAMMQLSSAAGIKSLLALEPKITQDGTDALELSLQEDRRGQEGDVRDILIIRRKLAWEIGVSVKHNHEAIKHSRISPTIDFGKDWLGLRCSEKYFEEIAPVFKQLDGFKQSHMKWGEVADKESVAYVPLLVAFMRELRRLDEENPGIAPGKMLEYLLGRKDFYKLISNDATKSTILQCFNLHGTLNTPSTDMPPALRVRNVTMPTKIYHMDFKDKGGKPSRTTIEVVMDNNWVVSLRIHSASTDVENSLKFDIQLTGVPSTMFTNSVSW